jgi:hypothetical protein
MAVLSKASSRFDDALLFDFSSLERKEVRFWARGGDDDDDDGDGGGLVSAVADEASATSWRQRSIRWDLEGGALIFGGGGRGHADWRWARWDKSMFILFGS